MASEVEKGTFSILAFSLTSTVNEESCS